MFNGFSKSLFVTSVSPSVEPFWLLTNGISCNFAFQQRFNLIEGNDGELFSALQASLWILHGATLLCVMSQWYSSDLMAYDDGLMVACFHVWVSISVWCYLGLFCIVGRDLGLRKDDWDLEGCLLIWFVKKTTKTNFYFFTSFLLAVFLSKGRI